MHEETINVSIRGTSPLLMNKFVGDEDDKLKKTKRVYDKNEETENSIYRDESGAVCQPSLHLEAAMTKAAVDFLMKGKKTYKDAVKSGIFVEPEMIPHKISDYETFAVPVVINRSRVVKARARLNEWELDFRVINRDERLTPDIIKEILETAGKFVGIGDWRPRFGKFEITKFEVENGTATK